MRNRSFVGPLLLIGLGAALLARNWYPDLRVLDFLARFWPYILIFWGALRFVEIAAARFRSQPAPPRGVSGGEWVLIVFLCLFGSALHTAQGFRANLPNMFTMGGIEIFGESFEYPVSAQRPASKTARVVLEDLRGDVQITGTDTEMVTVNGQLNVRAMNRDAADRVNQESPLDLTGDANRVVLHLRGNTVEHTSVSHALEIGVPKGASVEFAGRGGDVRIANVDGAVEMKGRGSDIDLSDLGGPVNISGVYNGSIQLQRIARRVTFDGTRTDLSVERVPGELRISSGDVRATNVVGPLHLTTRSHDVRIDGFTDSVDISADRGDLELRPGNAALSRIQAHARSGDIRLTLPPSAQFNLNAHTRNGEIEHDFGSALKLDSSGRQSTLQGVVGSGPEIRLETERGEIYIRKGGAESAAPAKPLPAGKQPPLEKVEQ